MYEQGMSDRRTQWYELHARLTAMLQQMRPGEYVCLSCVHRPGYVQFMREDDDSLIAEFARYFGKPELQITVDPETRQISAAQVQRDAVCGCARYVAQRLVGVAVDDAEQEAGLLHHHYPCLASMGVDADYGDTLMHISGNVLKDNVGAQVKPFKRIQYIAPGIRSEEGGEK